MGEGDEKKKISELYFEYDEALSGLKKINSELENLSKSSDTVFANIQKNLNSSFKIDLSSTKNIAKTQKDIEALNKSKIRYNLKANEQIRIDNNKHLNKMEEINARQLKSTKSLYDQVAGYAKTYLIYQGFNELKQQAVELVNEMVNVEYQMVQIDRVLNDSSLNINKYRDELIQLAYDYGNSFENVADITLRLAQAGFDAQESLALTEKTLLALNTAELNATQATSDMVAIMSQWNLMTGDATEVSTEYGNIIDKINKVADKFPTTSEDILNALKKTSSAFNLAGASIDETIALITTAEIASQRGGKAIGTAMNNIITQLKDDKRLNIMESLGIDLYADEAKTEFNSIIDIITQLSEKMKQLTADGKENSVEMQELLSVFTIFRRNIGSGLLSGVAGEDSVYAQVLEESLNSVGYSLQENEKHMKTAKAAQEQFNATLLELKTTVWDGGAEDVFRGLLVLGTDVAKVITTLVDTFGTLPTTMGLVTLAFSAFNKQLQIAKINEAGTGLELAGFLAKLTSTEAEIKKTSTTLKTAGKHAKTATIALKGAEAATLGLKIQTIALNAAWSLGLSLAITAVLSLLDNLIHAEEKAAEKMQEQLDKTRETTQGFEEEKETIQSLIEEYKDLNSSNTIDNEKISELNIKINQKLKEHNILIDESIDTLDKKIEKLKEVERQELKNQLISKQEELIWEKAQAKIKVGANEYTGGFIDSYLREKKDISWSEFNEMDFQEQKKHLEEYVEAYSKYPEMIEWANSKLKELESTEKNIILTQTEINELLVENAFQNYLPDIKSLEDYQAAISAFNELKLMPDFEGTLQEQQEYFEYFISKAFPEYSAKLEAINGNIEAYNTLIDSELTKLETLSSQYQTLTSAVDQYNSSGGVTVETFKQLIDNDLLQYLELVNGKLRINEIAMVNSANAAKSNAVAYIQEQTAAKILEIATSNVTNALNEEQTASANSVSSSNEASNAAKQMAASFTGAYISIKAVNAALKDQNVDVNALSAEQNKQIKSAINDANKQIALINKMSLSSAKASSGASKAATKTFEEQSKERVNIFKEEIDELESLEKSWVNKYKKLELFGTSDLKFITHQRINRYNEYLNQINQLTGISEEDRADLVQEYSSKRQEAELEYFDLLKQELEDQIDAFEEANEARIKQIEEAADAEIEALKKVEAENDRIREKEEYERKRNELLYGDQGIEYWKQRTGREAQKALLEAEKELAELDKDWEEKKEGWTLEDQIEEIENARDAQIKAIEEAQEIQIQAWKDAYKAQVDLYAQTGQIIYDGSIINAGYLYNAYMDNFVNPLNDRLRDIINTANSVTQAANQAAATAANAAAQVASTQAQTQALINNINQAKQDLSGNNWSIRNNPIIKPQIPGGTTSSNVNSTYSNLKKIIGKFHGGGEVGSSTEALALLRPKEVVLRPEWAAGMNKLVDRINKGDNVVNNTSSNIVQVEGDLVHIDAKVNNKQDIDVLTKQVEKVLKDKLNIKK